MPVSFRLLRGAGYLDEIGAAARVVALVGVPRERDRLRVLGGLYIVLEQDIGSRHHDVGGEREAPATPAGREGDLDLTLLRGGSIGDGLHRTGGLERPETLGRPARVVLAWVNHASARGARHEGCPDSPVRGVDPKTRVAGHALDLADEAGRGNLGADAFDFEARGYLAGRRPTAWVRRLRGAVEDVFDDAHPHQPLTRVPIDADHEAGEGGHPEAVGGG